MMTDDAILAEMYERFHDPEAWGPYCHGTSTVFLDDIMREGLKPRQCTTVEGRRVCRPSVYEGKLESKPNCIYLAPMDWMGTCIGAARRAANKFGGEPVILSIRLDKEFEPYLREDEDSLPWLEKGDDENYCITAISDLRAYDYETGFSERLPIAVKELIKQHLDIDFMEMMETLCEDLPGWIKSLITFRTMAVCDKDIAPENIIDRLTVDEAAKWRRKRLK